jgi:uncharacterized protein
MDANEIVAASTSADTKPIAPWWHTALIVLILGAGSLASAFEHGFPNLMLPGISVRLSGYLTVIAEEWLLALLIWLWLRRNGLPIATLTSGRWQSFRAFLRDLGLALAFLLVGIPLTSGLTYFMKAKLDPSFLPRTPAEAVVWIALTATAGFCEELVFRGYLQQQFAARTKSVFWGIGIQGLIFGLAHGYQGKIMIVIVVYGWLFGVFVAWRKSLLAAMLAHGLQDTAGGLIAFFTLK